MAHLSEGALRRMVDDPDARVGADAAHLETCSECKANFQVIADDARAVATLLAVPDPRVDVDGAFARVMREPKAQPALGLRFPIFRPARRPALALVAALATAAVVVVAFAAGGFFFQPTKVQAVPITLSDLQALSQLADYGTFNWTKEPQFQISPTAPEGDLQPPVVSKLPAGVSTTVTYGQMSQAVATFKFSAEKAAAAAAAQGKSLPKMPANMDGATLTITVGPAVGEVYGNLEQPSDASGNDINLPQLIVAKSISPTVTATQVSVTEIEDYIVQLPGISDELKKTIGAIGDPTKTLFIPVPVEYGTSKAVNVQGVDGVALGDNTGVGSAVVWIKGGHVWVVAGSIKQSDALDIANNLK
ncbi:MAG: hypothetical protein E6I92_07505 [Chloroflexi bacterium]|nr:MAG: hypothetical protein E6I92_07505 [Chloroflexota bacterium]